jgi:hypothetical protein
MAGVVGTVRWGMVRHGVAGMARSGAARVCEVGYGMAGAANSRNLYHPSPLLFSYHGVHQTCPYHQGQILQAACPETVYHNPPPEEVLMRKSFLFRVPGYHGMYDFGEIKDMELSSTKKLAVTEIMKPNHSRDIGKMTVAAILAKFG